MPGDFRLWVCLHEETHRVQFTAVPWLRGYLNTQIGEVVATADVDGAALAAMLREAVKRISEAARGDGELSIVDLVQTPAQREIVDRITAVMSLLEGHADVVMDGVGPDVIGSIVEIRRRFNVRRQGQGFDKIIRKLLGLDAKMRQYRDGAAFCKAVIAAVGMDGLNRVWTSPETLPTKAEIADPTDLAGSDGLAHDAPGGRPTGPTSASSRPMRTSRPTRRLSSTSDQNGSACARSRDADPGPGRRGSRWSRRTAACWWRAPVVPTRWPWPWRWCTSAAAVGCPSPRPWSTTVCSRPRPTRPPPPPSTLTALGYADVTVRTVDGDRHRSGTGGRCPDRALSGARGGGGRPGARPSCSATPGTTRPRRCCWDWRAVPANPVAGRDGRPAPVPAGAGCGRCSGSARAVTEQACRENDLVPWRDPHNADPSFARVRVRQTVLPTLEAELGPGICRGAGPDRGARRATTPICSTSWLRRRTRGRPAGRARCWTGCRRRSAGG